MSQIKQTAEGFTTTGGNGYPQRTYSTKDISRAGWDVEYVTGFGHWMPTVRTQGYPGVRHLPGANTPYGGFKTKGEAERAIDDLYGIAA